jgi:putative SOS response-associated peptidase YedK
MINARAETLLEKPSFKQLVPTRRCLVPADGFYEWRSDGNRKVPMWITLKNRIRAVRLPGLWTARLDRDIGSQLYTFTIITTRANGLVR